MEVIIFTALLGLFVFLGVKHKQNKDIEKLKQQLIDEAAATTIYLEDELHRYRSKVEELEKVQVEVQTYRQVTHNMVSSEEHQKKLAEISVIEQVLEKTREELDTVKGKQISERVRLGQVGENLIPFLGSFPYNPKNVRGLFQPIDLLVFNEDEIVFVEVKTGDAKLTEKQRNIKRIIEEGKVRFEVHMLKDTGYEIKC